MNENGSRTHLTDSELFGLAIPAVGSPEALPSHLSDCLACSRALQEWKGAVRDVGDDMGPLGNRSPEAWTAAEAQTMRAIRRTRFTRPALPLRWGVGVAAALLLFALAVPLHRPAAPATPSGASASAPDLSAQDQVDDALLRDVARLASAEETGGSWSTLVPEPGTANGEEDRL
ncbi:MAG: hypothetical protein ABI914_00365 [Acidobacteriota bacterium]